MCSNGVMSETDFQLAIEQFYRVSLKLRDEWQQDDIPPEVIVIVISRLLKRYSKAKGTSLFTSAATNQRGFPKGRSREAQVRFPEYQDGDRVPVKVSVVQMEKVNDQMGRVGVFEEMTF